MWPGPSKQVLCRQSNNWRNLCRLKQVTSRLSSSDVAQQPASMRRPRWLVIERYLKNLIEKSPASVCIKFQNFGDIIPVLMDIIYVYCVLVCKLFIKYSYLLIQDLFLIWIVRRIRDWKVLNCAFRWYQHAVRHTRNIHQ